MLKDSVDEDVASNKYSIYGYMTLVGWNVYNMIIKQHESRKQKNRKEIKFNEDVRRNTKYLEYNNLARYTKYPEC